MGNDALLVFIIAAGLWAHIPRFLIGIAVMLVLLAPHVGHGGTHGGKH